MQFRVTFEAKLKVFGFYIDQYRLVWNFDRSVGLDLIRKHCFTGDLKDLRSWVESNSPYSHSLYFDEVPSDLQHLFTNTSEVEVLVPDLYLQDCAEVTLLTDNYSDGTVSYNFKVVADKDKVLAKWKATGYKLKV